MIQVANLADSLAAVKQMVYDDKKIEPERLLHALKTNFEEDEVLRTMLLNKVPKYGNDVDWVDAMGTKWAEYFKNRLRTFKNYRGGPYHTGNVYGLSPCTHGRKCWGITGRTLCRRASRRRGKCLRSTEEI